MLVNSKKIIKLLEERYPPELAASWDNVGFQAGNHNSAVNKILVALEVTPAVIQEAIEVNAELIVCHHPLIFKPIRSLTEDHPLEAMLRRLTTSRISVYVAHTNADAAPGGTVDALLEALEIERAETFGEVFSEPHYKLAVYVPKSHAEAVAQALFSCGAGKLGAYSECSFAMEGIGTFLPMAGANPAIGKVGLREKVEEIKLEVMVSRARVKETVRTMLEAHPYEVPAYDLWPLEAPVTTYGFGATAIAKTPRRLSEWAGHVKKTLGSPAARMIGPADAMIRRIAVVPGAGGSFFKEAARLGCELLITGDVKYHEAQEALAAGIFIIDAGHFETELPFVKRMALLLEADLEQKGYEVRVAVSEANLNPFSIDF
jgi:dinuclear metal center YbgI/SA1388 family protein